MEYNNYNLFFDNAVNALGNYLNKNNLKSMILGLSGGLDSTVAAAICYEVSKKYNVKLYGYSMPTSTNTTGETDNAELCRCFCNKYKCYNINNDYNDILLTSHTISNPDNENTIASGNLKARIRMMLLYDAAFYHKGIVIDTDNMTEHKLGFFTVHGDVGDYAPIYPLWKHEVYELAEYIAYTYRNVLENTKDNAVKIQYMDMLHAMENAINLTPTDGNGVMSGGDMAQIAPGSTYKIVDDIITTIDKMCSNIVLDELYEKYDKNTVDRVYQRMQKNKFKQDANPVRSKREYLTYYEFF